MEDKHAALIAASHIVSEMGVSFNGVEDQTELIASHFLTWLRDQDSSAEKVSLIDQVKEALHMHKADAEDPETRE